jgi:2-polyprenyl-3-methyl-5-hydroxy-6-metoxy-1,4-benzoquinol methylase
VKPQTYSVDAERLYYQKSREDKTALSYEHLDAYVTGSVGLDFFHHKRVLDIGAGEGIYSAWIADRGRASEVIGIELTQHRIRWDYETLLPNCRFLVGNIFELEPPNEQFEVVFMNLVLHHLRFRLDDALRFVFRSLKPAGQFLAFEPNIYSPASAIAHLIHDRSANEGFLSPRRIRAAMERQGFHDVRVGYFWRNRWWAKNPLLASSFWIIGTKVT